MLHHTVLAMLWTSNSRLPNGQMRDVVPSICRHAKDERPTLLLALIHSAIAHKNVSGVLKTPAPVCTVSRRGFICFCHIFRIIYLSFFLVTNHSVDPDTAARSTVEFLRQDGWQRHTVLVPALGYWICIPLGIWLVTLAGFGGPAPKVFAPLVAGGG